MKILTKKKQRELLLRVAANEIIAREYIPEIGNKERLEAWTKMMENNCELAYEIGGIDGIAKVRDISYNRGNNRG